MLVPPSVFGYKFANTAWLYVRRLIRFGKRGGELYEAAIDPAGRQPHRNQQRSFLR